MCQRTEKHGISRNGRIPVCTDKSIVCIVTRAASARQQHERRVVAKYRRAAYPVYLDYLHALLCAIRIRRVSVDDTVSGGRPHCRNYRRLQQKVRSNKENQKCASGLSIHNILRCWGEGRSFSMGLTWNLKITKRNDFIKRVDKSSSSTSSNTIQYNVT